MKLSNLELCKLLDIPPHRLYKRCGLHDGNHFTWLTREIILNDWYGLGLDGQKYLIELMQILILTPHMRGAQLMSELFMNNLLCYKIPYINSLAHIYAQRSPFVTHKKVKN